MVYQEKIQENCDTSLLHLVTSSMGFAFRKAFNHRSMLSTMQIPWVMFKYFANSHEKLWMFYRST
jgi:hypothetical protein